VSIHLYGELLAHRLRNNHPKIPETRTRREHIGRAISASSIIIHSLVFRKECHVLYRAHYAGHHALGRN
jgi:hypothetical protein